MSELRFFLLKFYPHQNWELRALPRGPPRYIVADGRRRRRDVIVASPETYFLLPSPEAREP
jgi:hypothetical protein